MDETASRSAQGAEAPAAADPAALPVRAPMGLVGAGALFEDEGDATEDLARANWSVPWSDLMMTMFVLFAALLAVQALHQRAKAPDAPGRHVAAGEPVATAQPAVTVQQPVPEYRDLVKERIVEREQPVPEPAPGEVLSRKPSFEPLMQVNVFERSQQAMRETNLQNAEIVLLNDQSVKVSVQGPMFFALGKADLRPEVTRFLDRLAQVIRQTPYEIHVIGHTDDLPINTVAFPSNWELSLVRASRVARHLINSGGLAPSRFIVMGRGEYEPVAGNHGERSRALNRRVEIVITRTVAQVEDTRTQ